MAKNSVEVEIKIPVTKELFEKIKKSLERKAELVSVSRDVDKYFNAPHRNFLDKTPTEEFLRVRIKKDTFLFTYKHGYWNNKLEHTHSDEFETKVENSEQLEKILNVLNFENILQIDKKREVYRAKGGFEVSLDKVKGLGYFIEIESEKSFGSINKTMEAIYTFARSIGLDPTKRDSMGYVSLMMKKKKLFGR
jgi:adenylate cyclase class 2